MKVWGRALLLVGAAAVAAQSLAVTFPLVGSAGLELQLGLSRVWRAPHFTERPTPVYLGDNPGRDPSRKSS